MSVHILGDVKLVRVPRSLRIAHQHAVDPDVVGAVDAVEAQPELRRGVPRSRDGERPLVSTSGVLCGDVRRANGNRVLDVGVPGLAVALELPVARNAHLGPGGVLAGRGLGGLQRRGGIVKVPAAVEQEGGLRDEVGAARKTVASEDGLVAVVWLVLVLLEGDAGGGHLDVLAHGVSQQEGERRERKKRMNRNRDRSRASSS